MRRKKHKASRRIVRFFKLHFGFREPFKVLMDGNFLHAVLQLKFDNLEDQISTLLGAKVRLFVPSCVMRELRDMAKTDKAYQAAVALARKFVRHKDACPPTETTSDILLQQIGHGNEQHWWLATQDRALWATLEEDEQNPVPLLYASTTGLHLLPVSDALQKGITEKTMGHMAAGDAEHEMVAAGAAKLAPMARGKRKKPAAPNPLSVKNKSKVEKSDASGGTNRRKRRPAGAQGTGT